jgi:hypothetical protein
MKYMKDNFLSDLKCANGYVRVHHNDFQVRIYHNRFSAEKLGRFRRCNIRPQSRQSYRKSNQYIVGNLTHQCDDPLLPLAIHVC